MVPEDNTSARPVGVPAGGLDEEGEPSVLSTPSSLLKCSVGQGEAEHDRVGVIMW